MANIKSAKKRVIVNRTKAERNKAIRSEVKTSIKSRSSSCSKRSGSSSGSSESSYRYNRKRLL